MSGNASRPFAEVLEDGRVAVYATKVVYVLTAGEIMLLLGNCRSLWYEAMHRGKAHLRAQAAARRSEVKDELRNPQPEENQP